MHAYRKARVRDPAVVVSVMSQRRYHPAFQRMRDLIAEVAAETNCPVTSIQSGVFGCGRPDIVYTHYPTD